ncbi:hypothetical protein OHA53_11050 [Streptomyces althioticus]|uniref:hypothetical protein n=1 Tax=Streptomyces althioticus TaxID=83380 RepID=UPI00387373EA|nr:hypothetical protein OHA53_11050 [Streptomyces althioticus]
MNDSNLRRGKFRPGQRHITLPVENDLPIPDPPARAESWTDAMLTEWVSLWRSPSSVLWDSSAVGLVAILVELEARGPELSAAQLTEVRRLREALLLTPASLSGAGYALEGWPT